MTNYIYICVYMRALIFK